MQEDLTSNFQSGWPLSNLWAKSKTKKRNRSVPNAHRKQARVQQLAALVTQQVRGRPAFAFISLSGIEEFEGLQAGKAFV